MELCSTLLDAYVALLLTLWFILDRVDRAKANKEEEHEWNSDV